METTKAINIISFNIPYPADYGGVIDVFFKIRWLKEAGYEIILHTFQYNREPAGELNDYCKSVFYYKRKTGIRSFFSHLPYIVYSRRSDELLRNLLSNDYPVLFEGLHCCYYLEHPLLSARKKLVRMHNIEHNYYKNLSKFTKNIPEKVFYLTEYFKLRYFEKVLRHASKILPISPADTDYFSKIYGNSVWIGPFHESSEVSSIPGKGKYILIHGNLSISENEEAIKHILKNLITHVDFQLIIAGLNPGDKLKQMVKSHKNVTLLPSPDGEKINSLIREAHINLIYSFQSIGIRLKLINSLFKGRFVVANLPAVRGTGLEDLVYTTNDDQEMISTIRMLLKQEFDEQKITVRKDLLEQYKNETNIGRLVSEAGI